MRRAVGPVLLVFGCGPEESMRNVGGRAMRSGAVVLLGIVGLSTAAVPAWGQADAAPAAGPPRVVLIGDSIRLGYAPAVAARLTGKAVVISPPENGGDSINVLAHLDEW